MPTLTTDDDTDLYYEFADDGSGPAVVFLNGMTQTTEHWTSQVRRFGDNYRVLTYDARGQGESDLGTSELGMERHVADLEALCDALGLDAPHLVGFSHGARLALGFAANRPERVDRLAICSLTASPTALARTLVRSWRETLAHGGLEAMTWAALPAILGDHYLEQNEAVLEGIVEAAIRRNDEEGARALLDAMQRFPDLADLARAVETPTLVLSASEDLLVDSEGARELAELTGGRHTEISGVGHTIPIEAPDRFHRRVTNFLTTEAP